MHCAEPDKQLFDWGMMRLRRPLYGVGDAFAMDADDQFRKKRDAEVIYESMQTCFNFSSVPRTKKYGVSIVCLKDAASCRGMCFHSPYEGSCL